MKFIYINSIKENPSLCDGPGYRTVLFLQGCNLRCHNCHNKSTWQISKGKKVEIHELATFLREKCANKKLTISGGEPLLQVYSLIAFCKLLPDFNICLYTGHVLSDIPQELLTLLNYVKVGPFMNEFKTTTKPYVGSTNQEMIKLR